MKKRLLFLSLSLSCSLLEFYIDIYLYPSVSLAHLPIYNDCGTSSDPRPNSSLSWWVAEMVDIQNHREHHCVSLNRQACMLH